MCHIRYEKVFNQIYQILTETNNRSNLIPAVKTGYSFRYLGRHFDFKMSNNIHKSELSEITSAIPTNIDLLPLHPKNKINLYNRYLLS